MSDERPTGDAAAKTTKSDETGRDKGVPGGKGRPTPSRREAQAARKAEMKRPMTRREQSARRREARAEMAKQRRQAYATGDGPGLGLRDQGPVRRYVRDYVDMRWRISEFMLPLLLAILVLTALPYSWAPRIANAVWAATMVTVVFEVFVVTRGLKKSITSAFGADQVKGTRLYAVMRMTQPRFLRSPRPGIKVGQAPRT